jgi:hypothetical protein
MAMRRIIKGDGALPIQSGEATIASPGDPGAALSAAAGGSPHWRSDKFRSCESLFHIGAHEAYHLVEGFTSGRLKRHPGSVVTAVVLRSSCPTPRTRSVLGALLVALSMAIGLLSSASPAQAAGTWRWVSPGDDINAVISQSAAGDSVVLRNGTYPNIWIKEQAKSNVTLKGESKSGVIVQGIIVRNSSGVTMSTMTVTSSPQFKESAIRFIGSSHNMAATAMLIQPTYRKGVFFGDQVNNIQIDKVAIDGTRVTEKIGAGIQFWGVGASDAWPHDIAIRNSDIFGGASDNIFMAGAKDVVISNNWIHDVQSNADHNDGIQIVGGVHVDITSNTFTSPGATTEPDQAMMIGRNTGSVVDTVYIANNVIKDWRGTGIIIAGTSNVQVVNNSIARTGLPTFRMASVAVGEPNGFTNPSLRIWNNVIESISASATPLLPITLEDYNCVAKGGSGPHNVTTPPAFADRWTLQLAAGTPCLTAGSDLADSPHDDRSGATRVGITSMGAWGG